MDILSGIHYTDQSALRLGMNKQITYLDDCFIATPAQGPLVLDIKQEISRGLKTELQSEIDGFPLSPQRRVGGLAKILSDVLFEVELSNYCGLNSRGQRW